MSAVAASELPRARNRIASIDALRGLTILLMIFVNDVASVYRAPGWLEHFPEKGDGMHLADFVFPAFLFIVGMSLPFSLGRQMDEGVPLWRVLARIIVRAMSLLIVGVFMVNSPAKSGVLLPDVWRLSMYVAVILTWNRLPEEPGRARTAILAMRWVGIAALIALALLYHGKEMHGLIQLRPEWWGILGLIGWAYLVAAVSFVATRRNVAALVVITIALYGLFIVGELGWLERVPLSKWIDYGSMIGSQGALSVSGAAFALMLTSHSKIQDHSRRIAIAVALGCIAAIAGSLLHMLRHVHHMFIYNKDDATVPWCLWSTAWILWAWAATYFVMDVKGWRSWAIFIRPAGENPLFAYLLAPIFYAAFGLISMRWPEYDYFSIGAHSTGVGLARAAVFALGTTWLTGAMRPLGVSPRL